MAMGPGSPPQVVVPGAGWVDLLSRVIVTVGFPTVVAGVLLWFLLFRFTANVETITARMAANTDVAAKLIESEILVMKELQAQTTQLAAQTGSLKVIEDRSGQLLTIQQERQRMLQQRESR